MPELGPEANPIVGLEPREKLVVVGVGSDPKPDPTVRFTDSEGSIAERDAGGEDRTRGMNLLESETRVGRIASENSIGFASPDLNTRGEILEALPERGSGGGPHNCSGSSASVFPARCSDRAASAKPDSSSCVSTRVTSHCCSPSISSSNTEARASCSRFGSLEAFSNAFRRSSVIPEPTC
jgi:hypothetical protein